MSLMTREIEQGSNGLFHQTFALKRKKEKWGEDKEKNSKCARERKIYNTVFFTDSGFWPSFVVVQHKNNNKIIIKHVFSSELDFHSHTHTQTKEYREKYV